MATADDGHGYVNGDGHGYVDGNGVGNGDGGDDDDDGDPARGLHTRHRQ